MSTNPFVVGTHRRRTIFLGVLAALIILVITYATIGTHVNTAFHQSAASNASTAYLAPGNSVGAPPGAVVSGGSSTSGSASASPASTGASSVTNQSVASPYLVKSLTVGMTMPDTRQAAAALTSYITTTDPKSATRGIDYQQVGDNQYFVTLHFAVQATLYPQIESYLSTYAGDHHGTLSSIHEDVQDLSNDVIDTQARLLNLQTEETRLRTIMAQATAIGDVLAIEQQLSNVEGQIEQIQAHLNAVTDQTTYYIITLQLMPLGSVTTPPPTQQWSALGVVKDAWNAALGFGQWLLTLLIWLGVFAIYIVPIGGLVFVIWRVTRRRTVATPQVP